MFTPLALGWTTSDIRSASSVLFCSYSYTVLSYEPVKIIFFWVLFSSQKDHVFKEMCKSWDVEGSTIDPACIVKERDAIISSG